MSRILVSAVLALALSGCQSPPSPVESASKPTPQATAADKSPAYKIGADTADVFTRHEAPENGVPALLTQNMGGDGFYCSDPDDKPARVRIYNEWVTAGFNGNLPGKRWTKEPVDRDMSEIGWPVHLELTNMPPSDAMAESPKSGKVIIETPSGQKIQSTFKDCLLKFVLFPWGEYRLEGSSGLLTGRLLGRYRITLSFDEITATGEFHMRRAQHPRLITTMPEWPLPNPGSAVRLGVVGVPANSRQTVGLYRPKSVASTDFTFRTAVPVQTDANGEATFDLTVPPRPEFGCYLFALDPANYPTAQDAPIPQHRLQLCPDDRALYGDQPTPPL
ncbi:hypothetical protein Ssi03_14470 [Sphaerisporangium siamense]|uniref:Lipoprotein n=1 Tax=Sphaerisporangium siamense TaxID=795645 RepID=A0A7W7GBT7_9ACTN|nr:hypothetical protein [Sphaerisporangium siamense]MBB4702789.1 hypothetical protein [Sphaerisporangium siamense]GII83457.1 hypothetical protein Ssi03_14470 [Sphaerisporangium siamense]